MFIPDNSKFPYPEDTASHYASIKMNRGIVFDKDYPYIDKSFSFRFKRFWVRLLLRIIVFPEAKIKMGIRIHGKGNLKYYKKELEGGAISISNHVHYWDYICAMKALHSYRWSYLLSWDKNINNDSGPLVRLVGGIPIPENDPAATVAFSKAIEGLFKEKGLLHIYPEGSMWEYYVPIRPFKLGAASFAVNYDKPIIPMAYTYRKPGLIRTKLFKQIALFDLHIGAPIFPNKDLEKAERIRDLTVRAHQAVVTLSNNTNKYEAIYNHSKRID